MKRGVLQLRQHRDKVGMLRYDYMLQYAVRRRVLNGAACVLSNKKSCVIVSKSILDVREGLTMM